MASTRREKRKPEQIVAKLRDADAMPNAEAVSWCNDQRPRRLLRFGYLQTAGVVTALRMNALGRRQPEPLTIPCGKEEKIIRLGAWCLRVALRL